MEMALSQDSVIYYCDRGFSFCNEGGVVEGLLGSGESRGSRDRLELHWKSLWWCEQ